MARGEGFTLITDRFDLQTSEIIMLYAYRWQVELIFRFLKRTLHGLHFLCHHPAGLESQFTLYMMAYLLLLHFKQIAILDSTRLNFRKLLDKCFVTKIIGALDRIESKLAKHNSRRENCNIVSAHAQLKFRKIRLENSVVGWKPLFFWTIIFQANRNSSRQKLCLKRPWKVYKLILLQKRYINITEACLKVCGCMVRNQGILWIFELANIWDQSFQSVERILPGFWNRFRKYVEKLYIYLEEPFKVMRFLKLHKRKWTWKNCPSAILSFSTKGAEIFNRYIVTPSDFSLQNAIQWVFSGISLLWK